MYRLTQVLVTKKNNVFRLYPVHLNTYKTRTHWNSSMRKKFRLITIIFGIFFVVLIAYRLSYRYFNQTPMYVRSREPSFFFWQWISVYKLRRLLSSISINRVLKINNRLKKRYTTTKKTCDRSSITQKSTKYLSLSINNPIGEVQFAIDKQLFTCLDKWNFFIAITK